MSKTKKETNLKKLKEYCHSKPIYRFEDVPTSPGTIRYQDNEAKFGIILKKEVELEHPNIQKYTLNDIASKEVHRNYIHNAAGPAIFHLDVPKGEIPYMEIWLDGVPVFEQQEFYERAYNMLFTERLDKILELDNESAT